MANSRVLVAVVDRNRQTGDVVDLLRDSSVGGRRKTVIDAEYVDLDDKNRSRW